MTFDVHDLVRIESNALGAAWLRDAPEWASTSLRRAPWMVIRRERARDGLAAGIRGTERSQRLATVISAKDVVECIAPETLGARAIRVDGRLGDAARSVTACASECGIVWGPVGSFGFELASGVQATTAQSDFDIVVRASNVAREKLLAFERIIDVVMAKFGVRVDAELAFACGGVTLTEYATAPARVMLKTPHGPTLTRCP